MNKRLFLILVIFTLLLSSLVSAKTYHMTLLTVGETGDSYIGGTADAYLEVKPGSGRIFLDSFPLTKLDTQISTRYANKIACDYIDYDCSKYDFFYTIRADSTIVGGPSASGSLTILTIAALKNIDLDNSTVMTGTINSGGSIGPVGGVSEKSLAAQNAGFKRVLVPLFSINSIKNTTAPSISLINISIKNNSTNKTKVLDNNELENNTVQIEVIKVKSLDDAIPYFTNEKIVPKQKELKIPDQYTQTMKLVANDLCTRAEKLKNLTALDDVDLNKTNDYEKKINASLDLQDYYSAASYCFNKGLVIKRKILKDISDINPEKLEQIRRKALIAATEFDKNLDNKSIYTISELETYVIVKERTLESKNLLKKMNGTIDPDELAYAIERYYSAVFWSSFFSLDTKQIDLNNQYLEEACFKKIQEAEERINYVDLYLPSEYIIAPKDSINEAYKFEDQKNYKMCLYKASFAKSEANLLLSSISISNDLTSDLANEKLNSASKLIAKESSRGYFPIMGYSYYEYANTLNKNNETVTSLIFSEYALELSNIEIYFPKKESKLEQIFYNINTKLFSLVISSILLGFFIGAFAMFLFFKEKTPKQQNKRKNKK